MISQCKIARRVDAALAYDRRGGTDRIFDPDPAIRAADETEHELDQLLA
jgi:hypothetical protein